MSESRAERILIEIAEGEICSGPGDDICKYTEKPPAVWCGICKAKEYVIWLMNRREEEKRDE